MVAGVAEGAQHTALFGRGLGQHGQRLVGVRGDHHLVVARGVTLGVLHHHAVRRAQHLTHRGTLADAIGEACGHALDVGAAAALHRAPQRPSEHLQQAVVLAEADESLGGKVADGGARNRPDGRRLGQQVVFLEGRTIALGSQIVAEGGHALAERAGVGRGVPIEAADVTQHRPEPAGDQVAGLGEQTGQGVGAVFERAVVQRDGEGHLGAPGGDSQAPEKLHQVRIVELVIYDEPHVHGRSPGVHRMAVAPQPVLAFVDRHPVTALGEQPGRRKAGNAGAHHGDLER